MRTTTGFKRIGRPRQNVHGPSKRAFARHYVEMVAAMLIGMMILGPCPVRV